MLTASKLEKIIELENNLKAQYQTKLDALAAEIAGHVADKKDFIKKNDEQQKVIATQLEKITSLNKDATANKHMEQLNRELGNRSEKLQSEVDEIKVRVKSLQKDLAKEREELKELKKFDPARMKKNLDATKKKLVESQAANDLLQKKAKTYKQEKFELEQQVKELEAKLAALEVTEETEKESEAAAA
ncbi:hypothetical protein [Oceanicoccus sp. KOV_DT_Chl]|uniref:hypothetical protein n=1 Tax=Oceanicoccus sp. KOV_DT_Chl TaxID=1904639 RepID=UPI000C7A3B10|nr:hypothetical protein [Oceanicoccus sp. KOV_DT_Chl]